MSTIIETGQLHVVQAGDTITYQMANDSPFTLTMSRKLPAPDDGKTRVDFYKKCHVEIIMTFGDHEYTETIASE